MAAGILGLWGLNPKELNDCLFVGELSWTAGFAGFAHPAIAIEARGRKIRGWSCEHQAREAAMVGGVDVYRDDALDVIHF